MPASPLLKPSDVGDMINYILSLSDASTAERVEHKRTRVVARNFEAAGDDIPDLGVDYSVNTDGDQPTMVAGRCRPGPPRAGDA